MSRSQVCVLDGKPVEIGEAIRLRSDRSGTKLDFRCRVCGNAVIPVKEGRSAAHFQHLKQPAVDCDLVERYPLIPLSSKKLKSLRKQGELQVLSEYEIFGCYPIANARPSRQEKIEQFPLIADSIPEPPKSRTKYAFDILDVGQACDSGPYTLVLAKRLYSARKVYQTNHNGKFSILRYKERLVLRRIE